MLIQTHPEEAVRVDSEGGVCVERVVASGIDGTFQKQFVLDVTDVVPRVVDRLEADRSIAAIQARSLLDEAAMHTCTLLFLIGYDWENCGYRLPR